MEETKKPKRQLTEAQRLAFLEGRKKRLANIEKKKQEEEELKKQEETKEIQEVNAVETPVEPPERPVTPAPAEDPDAAAMKIADFVFDRIRAIKEEERKMNQEIVPPPPPKKTRKPREIKYKPPPFSTPKRGRTKDGTTHSSA